MITRIIESIKRRIALQSSEKYINYLRSKGIKIGNGCYMFDPKTVQIDYSRPTLLEIGNNVRLNYGLTILTHDYASYVFINHYNEFIPSHKRIKIGNNIWFGRNCTILKGVTIGDNCIIGYGSVVMKDIPANSVAAGSPAKVICSLEEYYAKREKQYLKECIEYAQCIIKSGKEPKVEDFYDDYTLFVDGSNYHDYPYPYSNVFNKEQFEYWKRNHKKKFKDFDDFMKYVKSNF
jgi:acetyltransferase-like isoleucine patch superfamily enzyme